LIVNHQWLIFNENPAQLYWFLNESCILFLSSCRFYISTSTLPAFAGAFNDRRQFFYCKQISTWLKQTTMYRTMACTRMILSVEVRDKNQIPIFCGGVQERIKNY
jgi:hypothetical protein